MLAEASLQLTCIWTPHLLLRPIGYQPSLLRLWRRSPLRQGIAADQISEGPRKGCQRGSAEYQTTNLGVGGSNPSGRANKINKLKPQLWVWSPYGHHLVVPHILTRRMLYDLVWSKPMTKVAACWCEAESHL